MGVEGLHVLAFAARSLDDGEVPQSEKAMAESGILLIRHWLEVAIDEQTRRLESRIEDPRNVWKVSDMDLKSYSRWYDYSRARRDVRSKRHGLGTVVRGEHRRLEAGGD